MKYNKYTDFLNHWGTICLMLENIFTTVRQTEQGSKGQAHMVANAYAGYVMTGKLPEAEKWDAHPLRPSFGSVVFWMNMCDSIIELQQGKAGSFCLLYDSITDAVKQETNRLVDKIDCRKLCRFLEENGWKQIPCSRPAWVYQTGQDTNGFDQVMIPNSKELSGYGYAMETAVNTIKRVQGMTTVDLLLNIAADC